MKKTLCISLASALALSLSVPVFAAGTTINQDSAPKEAATTITTSIGPTYTVTIPADTQITFNSLSTDFSSVELTTAKIDPDHVVKVSALAGDLENEADTTKTIPYTLKSKDGAKFESAEYTTAGDKTELTLDITQDSWDKAAAGSYKGTITFTVAYISQIID